MIVDRGDVRVAATAYFPQRCRAVADLGENLGGRRKHAIVGLAAIRVAGHSIFSHLEREFQSIISNKRFNCNGTSESGAHLRGVVWASIDF